MKPVGALSPYKSTTFSLMLHLLCSSSSCPKTLPELQEVAFNMAAVCVSVSLCVHSDDSYSQSCFICCCRRIRWYVLRYVLRIYKQFFM